VAILGLRSRPAKSEIRRQQRNEYEALEEAIPDLIRLERYERRAWSLHKRAIHEFMNIELMRMTVEETRSRSR
jgi:hypothetical protein